MGKSNLCFDFHMDFHIANLLKIKSYGVISNILIMTEWAFGNLYIFYKPNVLTILILILSYHLYIYFPIVTSRLVEVKEGMYVLLKGDD